MVGWTHEPEHQHNHCLPMHFFLNLWLCGYILMLLHDLEPAADTYVIMHYDIFMPQSLSLSLSLSHTHTHTLHTGLFDTPLLAGLPEAVRTELALSIPSPSVTRRSRWVCSSISCPGTDWKPDVEWQSDPIGRSTYNATMILVIGSQ